MDGQQVYVTGADGEQMVLSGPEAAALLEQAGINIPDGDGQVMLGEDTGIDENQEGIIQVPEGSTVQEDGSILSADGTILAPAGSVVTGEDGSLIMTEDASLLMQSLVEGTSPTTNTDGVEDQNIYATPDGQLVNAQGQLVNSEGQLLEAEGQEGQLVNSEGQLVSSEGQLLEAEGQVMSAEQLEAVGPSVEEDETLQASGEEQLMAAGPEQVPVAAASVKQQLATTDIKTDQPLGESEESSTVGQLVEEEGGNAVSEVSQLGTNEAHIVTTEDQTVKSEGQVIKSEEHLAQSESQLLENAGQKVATSEGQLITSEGQLVSSEGQLVSSDGQLVTSEGQLVSSEGQLASSDGQLVTSDGHLVTSEGQLVTSEGQIVTSEGHLISNQGQMVTSEGQLVTSIGQLVNSDGQLVTSEGQLITNQDQTVTSEGHLVTNEAQLVNGEGQLVNSDGQLVTSVGQLMANQGQMVTSEGQLVNSDGQLISSDGQLVGSNGQELNSGEQYMTPDGQLMTADGQLIAAGSQLMTADGQILTATGNGQYVTPDGQILSADQLTIDTSVDPSNEQPPASAQPVYTTADGSILSTNADGNLVTADGIVLTNEDGTPVSIAGGGSSILPTTEASLPEANYGGVAEAAASLSMPEGGIMVSSAGGTIMSASKGSTGSDGAYFSSAGMGMGEEGVINAPEGSFITEDGSLVAADGTVLAPPGSIVTEDQSIQAFQPQQQQPTPQQQIQQPTTQQQQTVPSGNLIGLQLPDENGEVLYLDPNDPAAQMLLQEAGITMGEGGVLQTADGQILTNEEGQPITSNLKQPAKNNLVGDAVMAAGLGAEELGFNINSGSTIDLPLTGQPGLNELRPELPVISSGASYDFQDHDMKQTYTTRPTTSYQQPTQKFQKLTFNSGANYQRSVPRKTVTKTPKRTGSASEVPIGPDQQKVTYTVTSENGYSQTYLMICSKSLDQNTLINSLIKNISNDPKHKGKKTIKITQHKYGAKKTKAKPTPIAQRQQLQPTPQRTLEPTRTITQTKTQYRNLQQSQQVVQRQELRAAAPPAQPPQQILASEPEVGGIITGDNLTEDLSLADIVNQIGETEGEPKVIVRCSYCTNFKSVLNSQTWENILNHILPVAREELHTAFYGNILKNFSRGLKVAVSGKSADFCEVTVSHGLVCRRTGTWYLVDHPSVDLAIQLATHIAAVQPGVTGPYGARPRGNSLICLFCASPYTAEDYQRHLAPHHAHIIPCLLLAAGAYCATSFELEIKKAAVCESCREGEHQDLRFLPCTKFANEFNCSKKMQATVDCFRENFDSRGFLQVSNSAMTKCSVCRTQNPTYCALFKITNSSLLQQAYGENEMLAVCANCQKQFVNVVMRENSFDKQLKMFQLHHMEQLCGVLRVLLSSSQSICNGQFNLLYNVQEGGSLYSATNTIHTVVPARPLHMGQHAPLSRGLNLEENRNVDMSGPQIRFICDQCKFSIDLTRLEHAVGKGDQHLVYMAIGVVLEHIVPHTESLLSVLMTAQANEVFNLKYEMTANVEGEGSIRRINVSLDRKLVPLGSGQEVSIQKELYKTIENVKSRIKPDKKGHVSLRNRYIFLDINPVESNLEHGLNVEISRFLDQASSVISLYGASGCNTRLLDYYSECRLCSKFSFPDFRLTAAVKNKEGVSLCENCCETITSLCVPSEPEKVTGRGEPCLLLGLDRSTGHRLVLSNQSKKWISADGVDKIQAVSEIATASNIPDYNNLLVSQLKSHLLAVCSRAWSDPDCVTARAGFLVKDYNTPQGRKLPPIEVKVTLRPPKPKTPPSKLQITPITKMSMASRAAVTRPPMPRPAQLPRPQTKFGPRGTPTPLTRGIGPIRPRLPVGLTPGSGPSTGVSLTAPKAAVRGRPPGSLNNVKQVTTSATTTPTSKLVKITANRRIIPVRDPTSINSPIRPNLNTPTSNLKTSAEKMVKVTARPETNQEKVAAMREALHASTRASEGSAPPKPVNVDEEDDENFETLEDIANFISSSEPVTKEDEKAVEAEDTSGMYTLQDEFTDNSLKCSRSPDSSPSKPTETFMPIKPTEVFMPTKPTETLTPKPTDTYKLPKGTIVTTVGEGSSEGSSEVSLPKNPEPTVEVNNEPVRIPATLKISEVDTGVVKIQAGDDQPNQGNQEEPEVDEPEAEETEANETAPEVPKAEAKVEEALSNLETLPSPASDATTSTRSTPTPKIQNRAPASPSEEKKAERKPIIPRLLPKDENATNSAISSNTKRGRGRPPKKETDLELHEIEHLTALDLDLDEDLDLEAEIAGVEVKVGGGDNTNAFKMSDILPRPANLKSTPTSSRKGDKTPKTVDKRKREDSDAATPAMKKAKAAAAAAISTPEYKDETPDYLKGVSASGRVRKAKKVFDM